MNGLLTKEQRSRLSMKGQDELTEWERSKLKRSSDMAQLAAQRMVERWTDPEMKARMLNRPKMAAKKSARAAMIQSGKIPCASCGFTKSLEQFPSGRKRRDGQPRYAYCKSCHSEYQRHNKLKRFYGITLEQYDLLVAFQSGLCAICLRPPRRQRLSVDHDHATGLLRGVLCSLCNRAIARFMDSPERLRRAAAYLEQPPAIMALGSKHFGIIGRISNKAATIRRLNAGRSWARSDAIP